MAQKSYALEHLVLFHLDKYGEMGIGELRADMRLWTEQLKLTSGRYDRSPLYSDIEQAIEGAINRLGEGGQIELSQDGEFLRLTELGVSVAKSLASHAHYFLKRVCTESS